jgi:CBS-domain-containing membrane protein
MLGANVMAPSLSRTLKGERLRSYLQKMRGTTRGSPPRVSNAEVLWSWIGAFLGIGAVAVASRFVLAGVDHGLMIGSLGASAVLVFGAPRSPLAQPRNLVGGHVLSALVGVLCYQWVGGSVGFAAALAVASAIALMHLTRTLHPPGGATALIAVIGSQQIHDLGLLYVMAPAGLGALILMIVGMLVNNLVPSRHYPEVWW